MVQLNKRNYFYFTGWHCEYANTPCERSPCFNGGSCKESSDNTFICECPPNYLGSMCEQHVCLVDSPCRNNGMCVFDGSCICPEGFKGEHCEINMCKEIDCHNGGTCESGICICQPGYTGGWQMLFLFVHTGQKTTCWAYFEWNLYFRPQV